ncbi:MAG: endolytic transglycosylase MltG [Candidatus Pacebacteria bacterium]|nr:endolytic transglycosylase MltG [Candidatus Paceibacterota bacterium]
MDNSVIPSEISPEPLPPSARKRGARILVGISMLIGFVALFQFTASPPADFPTDDPIFTIALGENIKSIGTELEEAHIIRSRFLFATLITLHGKEHSLPPGDYYFSRPKNVFDVARQIAMGDHGLNPIKITIPEGETVGGISQIVKEKLPLIDIDEFDALVKDSEGYLFPETYFFFPKATPEQVVNQMKNMFEEKTSELFTGKNYTAKEKSDIVILASLIEREAHGDDDREGIASVLGKRLSIGMALQVDASVAYAAHKGERALTKADFSVDSPYNTYKYKGLPPGPIANPGLQSLTAAINPAQTEYLYYLHDSRGTIHYAKTYKEHLANIKKYL